MKKPLLILFITVLCTPKLFAQPGLPSIDAPTGVNTSGQSGTGGNYDVKYHKMWLRINPDSNLYVKGNVQTNFFTTQNNVSTISFDLNSVFIVDSVHYNGAKLPAGNITRSGHILNIALGVTLSINTLDSVRIYYQGVPPAIPGFPEGLKKFSAAGGNYMTSVSESYEDRDWWPCKADMQDKIDSMRISLNVPWASPAAKDTFWGIANGMLIDSTISGSSRTFTYKTNYPIASYLVGISVGRFNHYYRGTVNISGTNVPVVYNLLAGRTPSSVYTTNVANLDKMNLVLAAYSQKFGDYPFKNEKHGYYDGLVGAGGIEHQTASCINTSSLNNLSTLAHELMHQWFGDNVSFSTWNDLWLAEGFAQYSESLVGELVPSLGINPYTARNSMKTAALGLSSESAWIPDANASNSIGIWGSNYGSTVYKRGGMVASMLRTMCGDTKYFQALTSYQANRGLKSANTDTLKNYFNTVLGTDISEFFRDYIGGSGSGAVAVGGIGHPINTINWNNPSPKQLAIQVASQSKSSGSNVSYFNGPVVLHVKGSIATQDTTIVFFDWGGGNLSYAGNGLSAPVPGNLLTYNLSFNPVTVAYDDSARTLSTGSIVKLSTLNVKVINFTARKSAYGNDINLGIAKDQQIEKVLLLRSYDGINFIEIAQMVEHISSDKLNNFYFNDKEVYSTTVYYKAAIISAHNTEYSTVVKISPERNLAFAISPNPAGKWVTINFRNSASQVMTIRIISSTGILIKHGSTGNNSFRFDSESIPNGVYEIQLIHNNEIVGAKKLMIQH